MPAFFGPAGSNDGSFDEFIARFLQGQRAGRQSSPVDINRLLSKRTHEIVTNAAKFAVERGQTEVDALHILRVMLGEDPAAAGARQAGVEPKALINAVDEQLPAPVENQGASAATLNGSAQKVLLDAYQVARGMGSTYINPENVFFAFVLNQDSPAGGLLAQAGVTPQALQAGAQQAHAQQAAAQGQQPGDHAEGSMLEKYGLDLTAEAKAGRLDPVIGRDDEIEQTIEVLARRTKNNPVLIGEAGVGKTAIVEGLAQAIVEDNVPAQLKGRRVISLDLPGMLAGTRYRGDFEERLTGAIEELAEDENTIVFIDELHTVVGAGGSGESGGMDAGNILKPRLARGDLHMVGATTLKEYRTIEKDSALERRFQPVTIGEPSIEDAAEILHGLADRYAEHHQVTYTDDALRAAVELSDRYITDRFLPDKAIDLIDQAGARLSLRRGPVDGSAVDVEALRSKLAELEAEKNSAVNAENYERAGELRDQVQEVSQQLAEAAARPAVTSSVIDEAAIAEMVSRATGIPAARMTEAEKTRLARLEAELHERVIGQDDAVTAIAKSEIGRASCRERV